MGSFFSGLSAVSTIGKAIQLAMLAALAALAVFAYVTWRTHSDLATVFATRMGEAIASREATIAALVHSNAENARVTEAMRADYQRAQAAEGRAATQAASLAAELARIKEENREAASAAARSKTPARGCPIVERTAKELWPAK